LLNRSPNVLAVLSKPVDPAVLVNASVDALRKARCNILDE